MIPRILLATAPIPGGGDLQLYAHGGDHMIVLGRDELMSTRAHGSEEALATMAIARLATDAPRLLIGGYGMGFTLRAALAALRQQHEARFDVVELVPAILDWARGPMAELTAGCLDDSRVTVRLGDVGAEIALAQAAYDAILLDVDNGPDGLVRAANDAIYGGAGLRAAGRALRLGGVLAVWSAAADPAFARRMGQAGFAVEELQVRARANIAGTKHSGGKGAKHTIWFGTRR